MRVREALRPCRTRLLQPRWSGKTFVWLQTNPLITLPRQGRGTLDRRAFDMVFDARPIIVGTFPFRIHRPRRFRGCGLR
jgi:hypothetical protein